MNHLNSAVTLAERLAGNYLREPVQACSQILEKGFVNQVCVVETASRKVVVRMNDADTYPIYVKEKWCTLQAAAAGIPGPEVLSIGLADDAAYMLLTFVEGDNGLDSTASQSVIWRQLGHYARLIHSIPVKGYGENLTDPLQGEFHSPAHPGSDGSWHGYVQYNINSLTESDPLIELGVLDQVKSQRARELFGKVQETTFRFGLIHGDLSVKNTMVTKSGQVILLDWGNAGVSVVPHGDLIWIMQSMLQNDRPSQEEFNAFLDGYGLRAEDLRDLNSLLLLKAFDNLRWTIDRRPDLTDSYAAFAKQVVDLVLQ